ncbi:hypothetical protein [Kitasatospora sp. NPDC050543]|uniref:hypothetical protein n=1 Tax=Kitasatospora sp. NPDC050543 TaxID=3364054 RepID=UPI0037B34583
MNTKIWRRAATTAAVTLLGIATLAGTAAAQPVAGPAPAPAPAPAAASAAAPAPGAHITYNPNAKPGSWENPVILSDKPAAGPTSLAASSCGDLGVYWCTFAQYNFGWVKLATSLGGDHHEYATAQGYASGNFQVYLDRSSNNGTSWQGRINVSTNDTGWTDSLYDGPPYVTRGCIYSMDRGVVGCTVWH